ncbi:phosphotransferase [Candidatus Pantoea persica]|uniref:phosphotransferase n=1 Tax=Candidatus Pantoea persica TaxID=2518128 RepID=UPI00215D873D|nr:phosphotransferase [Candidatus Pantoea persica]MBA2816745.1 Thiamine kinase [Candidatus Pantoea persica]
MSLRIDPRLLARIAQRLPGVSANDLTPLPGLTGQSSRLESAQGRFLLRLASQPPIPLLDRQREALLLHKLAPRGLTPRSLRLVPLHMDVHVDNLIAAGQGLHLIDWEYAADGDVALELATLCTAMPE